MILFKSLVYLFVFFAWFHRNSHSISLKVFAALKISWWMYLFYQCGTRPISTQSESTRRCARRMEWKSVFCWMRRLVIYKSWKWLGAVVVAARSWKCGGCTLIVAPSAAPTFLAASWDVRKGHEKESDWLVSERERDNMGITLRPGTGWSRGALCIIARLQKTQKIHFALFRDPWSTCATHSVSLKVY